MEPVLPKVPFEKCPIRASLGSLGRKWALLVLRDVAFFRDVTFSQILRSNDGMTPRVLSMRLKDLQEEGLIQRTVDSDDERQVRYRLTTKGKDVVPILTAFIQFGMRHRADLVFEDRRPRDLDRVFPREQTFMLGRLVRFARKAEAEGSRSGSLHE